MTLVRSGLVILLMLALGACGIRSDYDIGKELQPVTPIRAGIYVDEEAKKPTPIPVSLRGNTYLVELKNENGSKDTMVVYFFRVPEFNGYIMQLAVPEKSVYEYYYTRVTNARLEILDEDMENAVLPPHLQALFVLDENGVRTGRLKSGRDILVLLRAFAGARYPMKSLDVLKRVG